MAIDKPTKPNVTLPDNFGGIKTAYTESQIESGYEDGVPQIVDGGNINYEKDATFQKLKYLESIADVINNIPPNGYLNVDANNRFQYSDASTRNSYGNIGDIKYTMRKTAPYGGAWCDGSLYTKTQLPDLYDMLVNGDLQTVTLDEYNNQITSNGVCGSFGLDTANERFKVPTLQDVYIKASNSNPAEFGAESLPNIRANVSASGAVAWQQGIGAFMTQGDKARIVAYDENSTPYPKQLHFDASRWSSTYQNDAKVNPDHICYRAYVVVYTAIEDATQATWNLKANDSEVVHKDLDEVITGWKDFRNSQNPITIFQTDIIDSTTAHSGSSTKYSGIEIQDTNGIQIGKIEVGHSASNHTLTSLSVSRKVNGVMKYKNLTIEMDSSGNGWIENLRPDYGSLVGLGITLGTAKTMPNDGVLFINVRTGSQAGSQVKIFDGSGHAIGVSQHNGGTAEYHTSTFTAIVAKGQSINCSHNGAGNASIVSSYLAPWR